MLNRREHQREAFGFLQKHLPVQDWNFSLPPGSGMETYFVQGNERDYFVKVGAPVERYLAMAEIGLTPPVLAFGHLEDGISIMVQPYITGRKPSRIDYWEQLEKAAALIQTMHHHPQLRKILPPTSSDHHRNAGLRALGQLRQKWEPCRAQVPKVAEFVDNSLEYLTEQVNQFSTEGLVSSHGDICNANWLFASDGKIYLVDFDSTGVDDPALDVGALLWWYYPPELRGRFLEIAGYPYDNELKFRMQVRMAMHCLNITLPRRNSFDGFSPTNYSEKLNDFRAILNGEENPQGYAAQ
jgi:thiamine kinase-like enzyme